MSAANAMAARIRARRNALPLWEHPAIAGKHVVSRTRGYRCGEVQNIATCQCSWISCVDVSEWADQDRAVEDHWRDVIAAEDVAA